MSILDNLMEMTPKSIKGIIKPVSRLFINKYDAELSYWKRRFTVQNRHFKNSGYRRLMLAVAEETTDEFLKGKIIADFGCGPSGSLSWARSAKLRIGIDVLADRYADEFPDEVISHGMIYLKSTEKIIPLPSDFVDIMFTLNAMDHVDNFSKMCSEVLRVLKPGGELIGIFNLGEPPSPTEPQKLSEKVIREKLLNGLEIQSYRITERGPKNNRYAPFFNGSQNYKPDQDGVLFVKAKKPPNHE